MQEFGGTSVDLTSVGDVKFEGTHCVYKNTQKEGVRLCKSKVNWLAFTL